MEKREISCLIFVQLLFLNFIFANNVYAYIDPNTGGLFFTSVLPFVYGLLGALVLFWKRIANFFKGLFSKNKESSDG